MSMRLQAKLLRFLESQEFFRLGSAQISKADVRIVTATNRDLAKEVAAGRFRDDLYFRLKVAVLRLPSLRERRDDIPLLTSHFLGEFTRRHGKPGLRFTADAAAALLDHPYPGNIRELKNVIETAVLFATGPEITAADLNFDRPAPTAPTTSDVRDWLYLRGRTMEQLENLIIERTVERCGGNKTKAAEELAIGVRTIFRKVKDDERG
jgi:DNA-binding NtrC family response regulator